MPNHQVTNQSPVFENINLFKIDHALSRLVNVEATQWGIQQVKDYGAMMADPRWIKKGEQANQHTPVFHSHDVKGYRVDAIEFHPAYHDIMELGIQYQVHSWPYTAEQEGGQLLRMALFYLHAQNEAGSCCPLTMTYSCLPAIQHHLPQASEWIPKILSNQYDPANKPYFEKKGLTIGMAMTEKQGGTDVRANTTTAQPLTKAGTGAIYLLTGHKWFCSAPMCDAFLTLARTEKGISCFLLPRWKADGSKNEFRIQRLKDKLGNRSNASSEMEFDQAHAWLLGEEGRGIAVILEMVGLTRYDCMIGSTALMRRGLSEVLHHIQHRKVFGKLLLHQPLMLNVVADLCLEWEAALALTHRTAICLENPDQAAEQLLLRLLTPLGKYWITKRSIAFLAEAMECLGGNGYIETSILPRLYREAPVNAIWEGSGNVQCLDVLRAFQKSPEVIDVLIQELHSCKGFHPIYDQKINQFDFQQLDKAPGSARRMAAELVTLLQAAQLIKTSSPLVADAFLQSRLQQQNAAQFGHLPPTINYKAIVEQNLPN